MAVLLLSRGARYSDRSGIGDDTAFAIARARLGKLRAPRLDSQDDIGHLRAEGTELVRLFEGIERAAGDYEKWATGGTETNNRHV